MLQLLDIKKVYLEHSENEVHALKGVTLNFRECEFVSILGQSGCGKTTLLNLIGGLDKATSGEIRIDGVSTDKYTSSDWDSYRNEKIGFVFQNYNLIPHLNILTNVELALTISGVSASERTKRAKKALDDVGLSAQYNKLPSQISGGQAQRVAIARAIVNDPAILLADEPTGAIDSETSTQIMELLKAISAERLVIMVTHNVELAEKYSTRIIKVLDGEVIADSNPYFPEQQTQKCVGDPLVYAAQQTVDVLEEADKTLDLEKTEEKPKEAAKDKNAKPAKAAMPFFTAVKLSVRNMINKFGRSLITAVAGSIGIICIALILAVNNGFSNYIAAFEKQSMYKYPITASVSNETGMSAFYAFLAASASGLDEIDISSIFDIVDDGSSDAGRYTDEDMVHVYSQMGAMMNNFINSQNVTKDISRFKKHVDKNFDRKLASVRYDYDITMNIYARTDTLNQQTQEVKTEYTQISPISESFFIRMMLNFIMGGEDVAGSDSSAMLNQIKSLLEQFAFWDELVDNEEVITTQYDILAGHLPQNKNEAVLVVNDYNQISDFYALALNELGLDEFISSVLNPDNLHDLDRKFDEIIDSDHYTYYVLPTSAAFAYNERTGKYTNLKESASNPLLQTQLTEALKNSSIPVHISGIIRAKEGVTGCINGVLAYSHELSNYIIEDANNSAYVKAQQQKYVEYLDTVNYYYQTTDYLEENDLTLDSLSAEKQDKYNKALPIALGGLVEDVTGMGPSLYFTEDAYANAMYMANMRDMDVPQRIYFYANNVEYKDDITAFITDFNFSEEAADEHYTLRDEDMIRSFTVDFSDDLDATVSELHNTVTMITYILVGIALVSVLVTMFLIAIIMSISVQDRTREIGILRSLGARKVDIANIFNAETAMLGLLSGVFGVLLAYALQYPGNLLCEKLLEIGGVLQLAWWHPIVLIVGSVLLTVIAGFIPAISAAKKDPVIALRSE